MLLSRFRRHTPAMRRAAFLIACLWSSGALAQAPPAVPPKEVSPVTIYPLRERPKVVATYPAAGKAVSPGVLILTVTFDQEMSPDGFDVTPAAGGDAPKCLKTPRLLDDGKTFALLCTIRPEASYAVAFNAGPSGGFANVGAQRAEPGSLAFTTTKDTEGPRSIDEAMKAASLKSFDVPVQETPGLGNTAP
jgi:hypothetical protein